MISDERLQDHWSSGFEFYRRHHELVSRRKSLLHQGLSEPEFNGAFVYKFIMIMGRTDFSDQLRKIIIRHKRFGYDLMSCDSLYA